MLKNTLKSAKQGFTIIELLIVIAIIGILAGLVLNNFRGAQAKARDVERTADINNLHSQLEVYYNENSYYPDAFTFAGGELGGIDEGSLIDPSNTTIAMAAAVTTSTAPTMPYSADRPSGAQYTYAPYECDNSDPADVKCAKYVLFSWIEDSGNTFEGYTKNSLN